MHPDTRLTINELTQLAGALAEKGLRRAETWGEAIATLAKEFQLRCQFTDDQASSAAAKILAEEDIHNARDRLKKIVAQRDEELGMPADRRLRHRTIDGMLVKGSPRTPAQIKEEKRMTEPTTAEKPETNKGRRGKFAGMTITSQVTENPRRVGTYGYNSMDIILAAGTISYEDFIAQGGRPNDLEWDADKGHVTVA